LRKQERTLIVASHSLRRRENGLEAQLAAVAAQERRLAAQRAHIKRQRRQLKEEAQALRASSAAERAKAEAAWAQRRAMLNEAAEKIRVASAKNLAEHERLVEVRREAMAADPVRLVDENARLRASLEEAKRRLAVLEGEREEMDPTPTRRVGNI
jgi:chromosome segregation ATPase